MKLREIHDKCGMTFKQELLEEPDGRSFACEIWDTLTEGREDCENCLGENFNQLIQTIVKDWFDNYTPTEESSAEFYAMTYILWLYLFFERIEFIINEVDPNKNFHLIQSYRRSLKHMDEIRVWANFFKHPKHFVYVHWPKYIFVGQAFKRAANTMLINTTFLKEHYSSEVQDLPKSLENKNVVVVPFPKLDILTKGFCDELKGFFRFICDNKMVSDYLKSKSNLQVIE